MHPDLEVMTGIELSKEMNSSFSAELNYMDTTNDSYVNISPIRQCEDMFDNELENSLYSSRFGFSLKKLIVNLFNPVTVTTAVLTVMRCEDQLEKIKAENVALIEKVAKLQQENTTLNESLCKVQAEKKELIDLLLAKDNILSDMEKNKLMLERELCESQKCYNESQQQIEQWQTEKELQSRLICESQQHILILEAQFEQIQETLDRTQHGLEEYMMKFQDGTERIALLESTVVETQGQISAYNMKVAQKVFECSNLQKEVGHLKHQLHSQSQCLVQNEDIIARLTTDLSVAQEDIIKGNDRIKYFEVSVQQFKDENEGLKQELVKRSDESRRCLSDLTIYRETHSYHNKLFRHYEEVLEGLKFDLEENKAEVQLKNRQMRNMLRTTVHQC